MCRRPDALVDGEDHVHAVLSGRLEFFVHLPDLGFDGIELGQGDLLPSATDHGQIDGQVVPFDERKEGGLHQPASNQTRNGDEEQRQKGRKGNPRLIQGKAQDRRIHPVLQEVHDPTHATFHGIWLEIPAQSFAVPHVRRQNEGPLHKAEQQREHDDLGHVAEKIPQLAFDEEESRECDHGRDNRCEHCGQDFHGAIDGGAHSVFAHLEVPVDVLCDDNSVVHEDANHEDHPKQAGDVDGHPQHACKDEHASERHRNGKRHPKSQTDVQEQGQQKDHEKETHHAVVDQQLNALIQDDRPVTDDVQLQPRAHARCLGVVPFDVAPRERRHLQDALRIQAVDREYDGWRSVVPISRRIVFGPLVPNLRHVRQTQDASIGEGTHHNVLYGFGIVATKPATHNQLLPFRLQPSSCRLDVGSTDGRPHLCNGQVQFGQSVGAHRHLDLLPWKAAETHLA